MLFGEDLMERIVGFLSEIVDEQPNVIMMRFQAAEDAEEPALFPEASNDGHDGWLLAA